MPRALVLLVPPEAAGRRADLALARLAPELSRARVQRLIDEGCVLVDGRPARAAARLRGGERVELTLPEPTPSGLLAQDLPLTVLHEDEDLVVLDKAAGMVVHPARGSPHSTVVNALLHRFGGAGPAGGRLGLVHRLDRDTSGCLVVARSEEALASLQAAFRRREVEKVYLALCHGQPVEEGRLDTPYARHPRDRTRFTGRAPSAVRRAVTSWRVRERFGGGAGEVAARLARRRGPGAAAPAGAVGGAALLEVTLHTGRTHQNPRPPGRGGPPAARRRRLRGHPPRGPAARGRPRARGRPGRRPAGAARLAAGLRPPAHRPAGGLRGAASGRSGAGAGGAAEGLSRLGARESPPLSLALCPPGRGKKPLPQSARVERSPGSSPISTALR